MLGLNTVQENMSLQCLHSASAKIKKKVLHIVLLASATALYINKENENAICWQSTHRFEKLLSALINNSGTEPSRTAHPLINCMKAATWTKKNTFWH